MEHDVYAQQRIVAGERAVEEATYATKFMVCNQTCVSNLEGKRMTPEYKFVESAKPVGSWVLYPQATPYIKFAVYHKPTDEQIKNTEELLGWKWEDA